MWTDKEFQNRGAESKKQEIQTIRYVMAYRADEKKRMSIKTL